MSTPSPEVVLDETANTLRTVKAGLENYGALMKRATDELNSRKRRIERLHDALAGLVGLVQLLEHRAKADPTERLGAAFADVQKNHRYVEALQVLALEDQL